MFSTFRLGNRRDKEECKGHLKVGHRDKRHKERIGMRAKKFEVDKVRLGLFTLYI